MCICNNSNNKKNSKTWGHDYIDFRCTCDLYNNQFKALKQKLVKNVPKNHIYTKGKLPKNMNQSFIKKLY